MDYSSKFGSELKMAKRCMNYGMCKIDFLGKGICESGPENFYASYYPQGRMRMFPEFVSGRLPITQELVKIADSCNLCGKCNTQCYYLSENTPGAVMKAMKALLKERLEREKIVEIPKDDILKEIQSVVGERWASNDPAILTAYLTNDRNMLSRNLKAPDYVVLPETTEQVSKIVKIANKHKVPFLPRSTGSNPMLVLTKGIIIDFARMKQLDIDSFNYCATVGAGTTALELQNTAREHGLRMSIGESCVGICSNMMTTGIHSIFTYKYGTMADMFLDAEFVAPDGEIFDSDSLLFDKFFNYEQLREDPPLPPICTQVRLKLFEVDDDETVVFIPFKDFKEALTVAREIARKDIGIGGIVSSLEMIQTFMTLTNLDEENYYDIVKDYLKLNYGLFIVGNKYDVMAIKDIVSEDTPVLGRDVINRIIRGIPAITGPESMLLVETVMDEDEPYKSIFGKMLDFFLSAVNIPDDEVAYAFEAIPDKRVRKDICELFHAPVFSDIMHWFDFRPVAPRSGRKEDVISALYLCSFDDVELIETLCNTIKKVGDKYNIENYVCQLSPIENGRRVFLDYEFHVPRRNEKKIRRAKKAYYEAAKEVEKLADEKRGIVLLKNYRLKGFLDKDRILYNL